MRTSPINPELLSDKIVIPDQVIFTINVLIALEWDGEKSIISKRALIKELVARYKYSEEEIITNNWLNFKSLYEIAGFSVEIVGSGNETNFIFKKRTK